MSGREIKKISFFDTKPYDRIYFDKYAKEFSIEIIYHEEKLKPTTAHMAKGSDAVVAFVNDTVNAEVIEELVKEDIRVIAMRCAGYNNVDLKAAEGMVKVLRVPAYSPYAVGEHAMAMLLTLNRKLHRAYNRVREYNFSLNGLTGFDLYGRTMGIIGTGKIGRVFMEICKGFNMEIIAYDPYPLENSGINYKSLDEIFEKSDIISLHCPLTKESKYIINRESIAKMKDGVFILNTSRGALIDSEALLESLKSGKIGGAGLDVYEEETELFYEDNSDIIIQDDVLARLISMPNVLVTSHQAFLTHEALSNIAYTTLENLDAFFSGKELKNEIIYMNK